MKKNCENCKHLEWIDADEGIGSGFVCNKRQDKMYAQGREDELLRNLSRVEYREKSKVCHDPISEDQMIVELECVECNEPFTGFKHQQGSECFECFAAKSGIPT